MALFLESGLQEEGLEKLFTRHLLAGGHVMDGKVCAVCWVWGFLNPPKDATACSSTPRQMLQPVPQLPDRRYIMFLKTPDRCYSLFINSPTDATACLL